MDKYQAQVQANDLRLNRLATRPFAAYISAAFAGFFIAMGFLFSLYTRIHFGDSPFTNLIASMTFPIGLLLVVFAGSDLFTGMVVGISFSAFQRRDSALKLLRLTVMAWVMNFVGAGIFAVITYFSRTGGSSMDSLILKVLSGKVSLGVNEMIFRAILCNIFVCLTIWVLGGLKNEVSKILLSLAFIAAFVYLGLEHVVANMFIISYSFFFKAAEQVSLIGNAIAITDILRSLFFVTLGNVIGGAIFVALPYHLIWGKEFKAENK
ncbi:MAG: formate/nitrite transporter family protein [Eubacteriales bacterium]|nr:formate/nitrite transporter family protein [Eubacteriales bacterium]